MKLAGKVVVITGAANGLGKALSAELAAHDAVIVALDVDKVGLAALQNQLPDVTTMAIDVTSHAQLKKALAEAVKIHGQVDVWINNVGILGQDGPATSQDLDSVLEVFDVNVISLIDGSILAANYFKTNSGGWIVNILSTAALGARPGRSIYSASKHAGHGFTQALKKELIGTKVLAVYPDGIKTELFGANKPPDFNDFMTPSYVAKKIVAAIAAGKTSNLVINR